jgi:hypothetical protein
MERAVILAEGEPDRLVAEGLEELRPVFAELGDAVLVIGGLMTRIWLHLQPIGIPTRATADVDLGVDKRGLRLAGDRRVVAPLLDRLGFKPLAGDEGFRFAKEVRGEPFLVDLGVAPGTSRQEPPVLERGISTIAIPGLAYALRRRTRVAVEFVDDELRRRFELPLPELDAAFVLKGALVPSGVRNRRDRLRRDTVDAICLARACLERQGAIEALRAERKRSDVRKALAWVASSFSSESAAAARRVRDHFEDEARIATGGGWAVDTAKRFIAAIES